MFAFDPEGHLHPCVNNLRLVLPESTEELTPLGEQLPTDAEALETEVEKLKDAKELINGGGTVASMSDTLTATDLALATLKETVTTIKLDVKNMVERQKRLAEVLAEAEEKLG